MDRHTVIQIVAMLVMLSAFVRWIPGDDIKDPLGRGDPLRALDLDRHLQTLNEVPDASRAYLRGLRRYDVETYYRYWLRLLKRTRAIQAEPEPPPVVQLKGMNRNTQWLVRYDVYPLPTVGQTAEEGSTIDDPTIEGAAVIKTNLQRLDELSEEDRRALRQMSDNDEDGE